MRKAWFVAVVLLLAGAGSGNGEAVTAPPQGPEPGTIEAWLERLDEVAALYRDPALSFSCRETIAWTQTPGKPGRAKFDYLYAFDDRSGSLEDHRTLPREANEGGLPEDVSPEQLGVPRYLRSGMLWPLIFQRSRWPQHHYALLGEDVMLGRPAVRIHFDPIPPYQPDVNEWFGTAWVDRQTGQFLRIEAFAPESYQTWSHFQQHLAGGLSEGPYILERSDTDFGVERYGMRFPSRVWIEEAEYRAVGSRPTKHHRTAPLLTVEQTFDEYRFVGVRPEAEIK
jgi:hypothetical protein